jgi:hypothetical protein
MNFLAKVIGSELLLALPYPISAQISLLDLKGHPVMTWAANSIERIQKFNVEQVSAGQYIVQIPQLGTQFVVIAQ